MMLEYHGNFVVCFAQRGAQMRTLQCCSSLEWPYLGRDNAQKASSSTENLRHLRPSLFLAQEVGCRLGRGAILLRTLPP